jgi:murein DD-endopeptidase MepM/ murein hydrolase activator NlpD
MNERTNRNWKRILYYKIIFSCVFFVMTIAVLHSNYRWTQTMKNRIQHMLTESFDKQSALDWYKVHFQGFPAIIPSYLPEKRSQHVTTGNIPNPFASPIVGKITRAFDSSTLGVTIAPTERPDVFAIDRGKVMYVISSGDSQFSIIIRHDQGIESIYSGVSEIIVHVNDIVTHGQKIGRCNGPSMYFSILRRGQAINPNDVIDFG